MEGRQIIQQQTPKNIISPYVFSLTEWKMAKMTFFIKSSNRSKVGQQTYLDVQCFLLNGRRMFPLKIWSQMLCSKLPSVTKKHTVLSYTKVQERKCQ